MGQIMDLWAKLTLDSSEYEEGLEESKKQASVFGDVLKADLVSKGIDTAVKGVTTLGKATIGLVEQSVGAFGQYEQLVGGVETLFKDSADKVQQYAEDAYRTAGMSTNEYMETVTSFSASLIQSTGRGAQQDTEALEAELKEQYTATKRTLQDEYEAVKKHWNERIKATKDSNAKASLQAQRDEELKALKRNNEDKLVALKQYNKDYIKQVEQQNSASTTTAESLDRAAELANMAIIDMSDNANKMGTTLESVKNAYNGFAKANYTMLDNLKLGYGGTKEEMQRLLDDAERLTGKAYELSSYADIVEAIHAIQTEIGITGTTAKEASGTIEGSIGSFRSAWDNLITGLARDDADLDYLINAVVDSAEGALTNILPIVDKAIDGIGKLIDRVAPIIQEKLPPLVEKIVPSITQALGTIGGAILPMLPQAAGTILSTLFGAIVEQAPGLIPVVALAVASPILGAVKNIVGGIGAIKTALGGINAAATAEFGGAAVAGEALGTVLAGLATAALGVADALLIAYDVNTIKGAVNEWNQIEKDSEDARSRERAAYMDNYVKLYNKKGKEVADEFARMVTGIDTTAMDFEQAQAALAQQVEANWEGVATNIGEGIMGGLKYYFGSNKEGGGIQGLIKDGLSNAVSGIKSMLGIASPSQVFYDIGVNMMQGLQNGINSKQNTVFQQLANIAQNIRNTFARVLKINSPSKVMEEMGVYTVEGLVNGIMGSAQDVTDAMGYIAGTASGTTGVMPGSPFTPDMINTSSGSQRPINIVLELDGVQFARTVYNANNEETQRVGVQLAGGIV